MREDAVQVLGVVQRAGEQHDVVLAVNLVHVGLDHPHAAFAGCRRHVRVAINAGHVVTEFGQGGGQRAATTTDLQNSRGRRG